MSTNTNTRMVSLGDLLTDAQATEVARLAAEIKAGADKRVLREYLRTQSQELESKGVLPDYLFWALVYKLQLL